MLDEALPQLGPALVAALRNRGFSELTRVQQAVLAPELSGRDLRVTSQTGSGKTVAIGLSIRTVLDADTSSDRGIARPRALVVAPTRELAKQVEEELAWLFEGIGVRVAAVTGGSSYRDERRALASGPGVVVGTPGRLLDHLERGGIVGGQLGAVVLDEADRLLDMGFRDDLEKILSHAPAERRTHLVSATFPREVRALADKVQSDPAHVEGTRLGVANADIDHVIHLVAIHDRFAALVNLLLSREGEQTLIFARTRADVGRLAEELDAHGFRIAALSGEMEQRARERALAAFKTGDLDALVATDVAARGIDVQDIARVIHFDPPGDADTYTHRSGRTGRAGKKGTSAVMVAPSGLVPTLRLLARARVTHRFEPVPSAESIRAGRVAHLEAELVADDPADFPGFDDRTWGLAKRLAERADATRTIARLLSRVRSVGRREPLDVRVIAPPVDRNARHDVPSRFSERTRPSAPRPERTPREPRAAAPERAPRDAHAGAPDREFPAPARTPRTPKPAQDDRRWVTFSVSWGETHGADSRRMLPIVCRRGEVKGSDVGAIRIGRLWSTVEIAEDVASAFEAAAKRPDPRDPRITFARGDKGPSASAASDTPRKPQGRARTPSARTPAPARFGAKRRP